MESANTQNIFPQRYKIGESIAMKAMGIVLRKDDQKYIALQKPDDPDAKFYAKAYDFQAEWVDKFPIPMPGTVIAFDGRNNIYTVKQWYCKVLEELYPKTSLPKKSTFIVLDEKMDDRTSRSFYILKDAYGLQHRYYTHHTLEIGTEVELNVIDVVDTGYGKAHLEFKMPDAEAEVRKRPPRISESLSNTPDNETEESDFGSEDNQTEFKSSIVFVPSKSEPDIDEQIKTIMKTIAGFMNKIGGKIYLGVNDSGNVCGIEHDFPHLNDSQIDKYQYKSNTDSYQLKLQNSISRMLGTNSALEFVDIKFDVIRDMIYCVLTIKPSPFPVFVNGTQLYQRMGNQTNLLKNEEITNFYRFKYSINIPVLAVNADTEDSQDNEPETETKQEREIEAEIDKELKDLEQPIQIQRESFTPWRYLRLYADGKWSWGRKETRDRENLVHEIVLPKERKSKDTLLLMCYANGCIDSVTLSSVFDSTPDKIYSNGWIPQNGLLKVFSASPSELIAFRSTTEDGEQWNKFHQASDFSVHKRLGNQGVKAVNENLGGKITNVATVPISCAHQLGAYVTRRAASQFLGYPRSDENRRDSLPLLDAIFN